MLRALLAAASAACLLAACGQPAATTDTAETPATTETAATTPSATDQDDGVLENAGEVIDGAGDHVEESVNDATDDNPNTNP
jgi:hypothetical protein